MRKLTCIIVDDEPLAQSLLKKYISRTDFLELKHSCKNALIAGQVLENEKIDIVFLDIQMPGITGLDFSKKIENHTKIIFTTAYEQYAIQGYKVNALDYLLKPFNYSEFLLAVLRAKDWFDRIEPVRQVPVKEFIFVKSEYKQVKVLLDNVWYFEGLGDYIKVWLVDKPSPVLTIMSLKSLEKELAADKFMRIHRSFIISLDKIQKVEKNQVVINNKFITIARQYKDIFQNFLKSKTL